MRTTLMVNIEKAMIDPASEFRTPRDVFNNKSLSKKQKIDILKRWAYDEREMSVAEEENMLSPESEKSNMLDEILKILLELGEETDQQQPPPTKQG